MEQNNPDGADRATERSAGSASTETTGLVVLRPEEARRLIGAAVAGMQPVRRAAQSGRMVIVGGGATRHVAHALTGEDPGLEPFAMGWIQNGRLGATPEEGRGPGPVLFEQGRISRGWPGPLLERFQAGDVYIKGANAIDPDGNAAILMASPTGGTIGAAMAILFARGGELILPVSLEKLIPSVPAACRLLGQGKVDRVMGLPVGLMPILAGSAEVVTEVEAVKRLFGLRAVPVAAGGALDCAGAVVLHVAGPTAGIDELWKFIERMRKAG